MKDWRFRGASSFAVMVAAICFALGATATRAQISSDGRDSNSAAPSADTTKANAPGPAANGAAKTNEAILAELEQMRARIAELEALLKAQNVQGQQPALVSAVLPAKQPASSSAQPAADSVAPAAAGDLKLATATSAPDEKAAKAEPFAFADFTWLTGNSREKDVPWDSKFFTPEVRVDVDYVYDFHNPKDDTIGGSSEVFRSSEVQLTQLGVGGDFHYDNVRGRLMTQFGMYSQTTPRNDASPARGQWNLSDAYRYVSEAYGGYHFNVLHGVNVDAGIFMSYVGLFSYYQYDNWAYQPSYVSSNTPWFFNGVRVQIFPTEKLKIEPWFVNGWQSYGRFNGRPGLGIQVLYRPTGWLSVLGNQYGVGEDDLNTPGRTRMHSDNSIQVKYFDRPDNWYDKMAFTLTGDIGCESGAGVACFGTRNGHPKQSFLGFMAYDRTWFHHDLYAFTVGGGKINNPGRYLVLLPPINGATAATGTPYFTENPGDPYKAWDVSTTFDYMPSQYITFRWEANYRAANVPYFSGRGGVTPPGGNNGSPASMVCLDGSVAPATGCPANIGTWFPDLRKNETRITMAILVKF
jgi:hypothetical protein